MKLNRESFLLRPILAQFLPTINRGVSLGFFYEVQVSEWKDLTIFNPEAEIKRTKWVSRPAWKFTQDKDKLLNLIPKHD